MDEMDDMKNMTEELWSGLSEKERARLILGTKTIKVSGLIYQTVLWKAEDWGVSFDDAMDTIFGAGMYHLCWQEEIRQSASRDGDAVVYPFPRKGPDFRGQS